MPNRELGPSGLIELDRVTDTPSVSDISETLGRTKRTSYTRTQGDFSYDVYVYDLPHLSAARRFYALVVNMMWRTSGETRSIPTELPGEFGATPDGAVSKIDATVLGWIRKQPPQR